jgi:hypothetical protein
MAKYLDENGLLYFWNKIKTYVNAQITSGTSGYIPTSQKGTASGVATLDTSGKVPTAQLPSYVDDVLEGSTLSAFPATGETGKIYVALDTNKTYRWSGSAYIDISAGSDVVMTAITNGEIDTITV